MTETDAHHEEKNWLTSIPERLSYAWHAPEQRFEWLHLTRRRFFRNLCNMPGELVGWAITTKERGKKPLFPDMSGNTSYHTPGQAIDSSLFTGMLFKQALDIGAKFGLSAFVKTAVAGYNRDTEYHQLLNTSSQLRQLAAYMVQSDPALDQWATELVARDASPLLRLSQQTDEASRILMEFSEGKLLPTDENIDALKTQLTAISTLCDQQAGVLSPTKAQGMVAEHPAQALAAKHLPEMAAGMHYAHAPRPSDHIREALQAEKLLTGKQAVTYLAVLSGLVLDGARDISSELFTPKEENYFTAQEAHLVTKALKEFAATHALKHPSPQEVLQLANHLKASLRAAEQRITPMLAYADLHFAEIDQQFKPLRVAPTMPNPTTRAVQSRLTETTQQLDAQYYAPRHVGLDYVVRDETKHEMFKLYSRSLPAYLFQAPINLIERLLLPNAKGKWEFNKRIVGSELKAASWLALYNPAAESFGGVGTFEATRLDLHRAVEAGKRLDAFMTAAVHTTQAADPAFASALRALGSNQSYQALVDAHRDILTKPAATRTAEDYAAIGQLMRDLAAQAETARHQCQTLLIGSGEEASLKQHLSTVFAQGAKTTADALLVMALARFLEHAAEGQILSYEYVDPETMVLDKRALSRLSAEVLAAAQRSGFAIAGELASENGRVQRVGEAEKLAPGTLVRMDKDGHFRVATQSEFVGFANIVIAAMGADKGAAIQKFLLGTQGKMSDAALREVERNVLEQFQPTHTPPTDTSATAGVETVPLQPVHKKHPEHKVSWRESLRYVLRPEAVHEMHQLRDRYLSVALFGFPVKIITNILRGDFDKISTAFGKWSLASTAFSAVANTFAPSYGAVALKEATSVGNIALKQDCISAADHLQAAIRRLGESDPAMKTRLIASLGVNPLLAERTTIERLALSGDSEEALNHVATAFIDHTATALAGKPQAIFPEGTQKPGEIFAAILALPRGNPAYAALKLATLEALIRHEHRYIDMLRFEGKAARLLQNAPLKTMVGAIEDRFYTEGESLKTAPPETITAIADELAALALPIAQSMQTLKPSEYQPGSDRIKKSIASAVATGLG